MADYTPSEEEIAENRRNTGNCDWVELTEAEVRRGIARIKAEALREALEDETEIKDDHGHWESVVPVWAIHDEIERIEQEAGL
jgi:NAD-dependent oxidoreductase involved in siderophore biosynthesis